MPSSFTKIYVHIVFAPRSRLSIHSKDIRDRILHYMGGIITHLKS